MGRTELLVRRLGVHFDTDGRDGTRAMRLEMEELRAVRDLRAGDETAMAWFMDRHGALVWRICRAILSSDADAEEAWQDTYLKLWLKIGKWNPDRGSLAAWLARIARHSAIDAHRRLKRRREVLLFAYDDDDPLTRSADVRPLPDAVAEQSDGDIRHRPHTEPKPPDGVRDAAHGGSEHPGDSVGPRRQAGRGKGVGVSRGAGAGAGTSGSPLP